MDIVNGIVEGEFAIFSDDYKHRYLLRRNLKQPGDKILFIMLNPSTADENKDDNTVRRCRLYAIDWGYAWMEVTNIFAIRSTDPKALYEDEDPVGHDNDYMIDQAVQRADKVICAWGSHGDNFPDRVSSILEIVSRHKIPHALAFTKSGQPRHPLYLAKSLKPIKMKE